MPWHMHRGPKTTFQKLVFSFHHVDTRGIELWLSGSMIKGIFDDLAISLTRETFFKWFIKENFASSFLFQ